MAAGPCGDADDGTYVTRTTGQMWALVAMGTRLGSFVLPPLAPGDTVAVTKVKPSTDLTVVERVTHAPREGPVDERCESQPAPGQP